MTRGAGAALAVLCALSACVRGPAPPAGHPHFTVGAPYQVGGVWRYPRVQFTLDETGLATVAMDEHPALTADGEEFDQANLAAAHRTLQLPAVARVTNLDNGTALLVRVNDRGPASPARLLSLTRRAAELLEARDGTRIRVQVLEGESRRLAEQLEAEPADGPLLAVAAVPEGRIAIEPLPPPAGARAVAHVREARALVGVAAAPAVPEVPVPLRLPEQPSRGTPSAAPLFVDCGAFSRPEYARLLAARLPGLGARLATRYDGPRNLAFVVRIGPLASVAAADAALEGALRAGAADARIVVGP